ncbi:hypothetical protein SB11R_10200 [Pseudomonas oryzihabitans]|uniref:LexA family protein n=1 Tax=uncultured Pseudomonas sp. TaxID=114707 RepID=UPI00073753FF|nr:translesion error-prone DNA polymerase V autoproteolytic subunit [uncultured Pseudomonas sp.]KTT49697.1 hypothetical protein SB11R_10200 [Pseudomonas psychrotolerans]
MSIEFVANLAPSETALPVYLFRVPCGFPSPAQDHLESVISLDDLLNIKAPHTYIVRATGDSMMGLGIFPDDLLIITRAREAVPGDVVVAALNREPLIKTLQRNADGQYELHSANRHYKPIPVREEDEFEVWGIATDCLRRLGHA